MAGTTKTKGNKKPGLTEGMRKARLLGVLIMKIGVLRIRKYKARLHLSTAENYTGISKMVPTALISIREYLDDRC
jgi:hypothetical protein